MPAIPVEQGTAALQDRTVQDLDKLLGQAKMIRARHEPVWLLNLAYFMGDQWVFRPGSGTGDAWTGQRWIRGGSP